MPSHTLRASAGIFNGWLPTFILEQTLRIDGVSEAPGARAARVVLEGGEDGLGGWLQDAETGFKAVFGVGFREVVERLLLPALRRMDLDFAATLLRQKLLKRLAATPMRRAISA